MAKSRPGATEPESRPEIRAGPNEEGPYSSFATGSPSEVAGSRTTFHLANADERYYLLWITNRGRWHAVHINEVTASG